MNYSDAENVPPPPQPAQPEAPAFSIEEFAQKKQRGSPVVAGDSGRWLRHCRPASSLRHSCWGEEMGSATLPRFLRRAAASSQGPFSDGELGASTQSQPSLGDSLKRSYSSDYEVGGEDGVTSVTDHYSSYSSAAKRHRLQCQQAGTRRWTRSGGRRRKITSPGRAYRRIGSGTGSYNI